MRSSRPLELELGEHNRATRSTFVQDEGFTDLGTTGDAT
jgi:hypothetical protein